MADAPDPVVNLEQLVETEVVSPPQPPSPSPEAETPPAFDPEALVARNQQLEGKVNQVLKEKKRAQAKLAEHEEKFQAMLNGLSQLAGLEAEEPDPKELTRRVADLQTDNLRKEIENRAIMSSVQKGLDPSLAVPVLQARGKLDLDLADADFEVALEAALDGLAAQHPELVTGQVAQVAKPAPDPMVGVPSGASPATNLSAQLEQVIASRDSFAIADFVDKHGAELWGGRTPASSDDRELVIV